MTVKAEADNFTGSMHTLARSLPRLDGSAITVLCSLAKALLIVPVLMLLAVLLMTYVFRVPQTVGTAFQALPLAPALSDSQRLRLTYSSSTPAFSSVATLTALVPCRSHN